MTLVSSLIGDAYRESNMLALGKAPTDNQNTEALRLYNQILAAIYGGDAGEPLIDWPLGSFDRQPSDALPYTIAEISNPCMNRRLIAVNDAAITIYLADRPQDGARYGIADPFGRLADFPVTLDANGRIIEGNPTLVLATNGTFREWLYRADLGAWLPVNGVVLTDENPFPADFDIMFEILLAMRLNPRYGRELDPQSQAMFKQNRQQFVARYLQSARLDTDDSISWPFLSRQSYGTGRTFSSTDGFNTGRLCP